MMPDIICEQVEGVLRGEGLPVNGDLPGVHVTVSPGVAVERKADGKSSRLAHNISILVEGGSLHEASRVAQEITMILDGFRLNGELLEDTSYLGAPVPDPVQPCWVKTLNFAYRIGGK